MKLLLPLFLLLTSCATTSAQQTPLSYFKPSNFSDLRKSSVRIYNLEMNSGGTGSIFRSDSSGSTILTNKHVCRLIEPGGIVEQEGRKYLITRYKKYPNHDLCFVRVSKNFEINLKISGTISKPSDTVFVSGHPNLLPHIATRGHMSGDMVIQLVTKIKECSEEDLEADPSNVLICMFMGGLPIIESFDSNVVSNLIKPGSSGSAVFNKKGEIVGVVFAGSGGEFSHGFIVPQKHVYYFTNNESSFKWVKVGTVIKEEEGIVDRVFNFQSCDKVRNLPFRLKSVCANKLNDLIWRL